jgi:hypothetical protein
MKWRGTNSSRNKKFRLQKSRVKTVLIFFFFFYSAGILRCVFVSKGTTVNNHYLGVMERLYAHMRHVRNEQFRNSIKTRPLIARRMCFQIYLCYTAASLHP